MALAPPRFFSEANLGLPKVKQGPGFTDVGGIGDCGFRALAAAFLSKAMYEKRNSKELSRLLDEHFKYFPEQKPKLPLMTSQEKIDYITKIPGMPVFVQTLAYTLRQMAVDEIVAHPEYYRGAFFGKEAMPISPQAMRLETTWIDETAIAAVAKTTGFPVEVQVVTPSKSLPLRLEYGKESTVPGNPLVIELQNNHYRPYVSDPARFRSVKAVATNPIHPQAVEKKDPELKEVLARINAEDERLLKKFEETKKILMAAVLGEGLSKKELLDIYVAGMEKSDYLEGYKGYVGTEHGSERFFTAVRANRDNAHDIHKRFASHDEEITNDLVHAIARAVSINQINPSIVFDKIERTQEHRTSLSPQP
ncbi:OTU domain-containing protein [Legionella cardiaca]|uniref:OTU domain-containing protein n=1 Tax=Legionella cardiaca TaxID=1071983 RepID=A0ABY8ARG3_9GAMM|nr:OTU domain-containing protein [Legionella cardiaca]WED43034.1 hypothetical protein PXX05_14220 [Legionella cardiaca]